MIEDSVAPDQLRSFVRRIEALEDEIKALNDDKSEVYKEAKGNGFDVKVLRKLIADRRKDANERMEFDAIYELYAAALGMVPVPYDDEPEGFVRARVENIEQFDAETGEITEPQAAPQPASDLTAPQPLGQVADIQPETANHEGEAQKVERRSPKPEDAGSIPATFANAGSSNGRTAEFDSANAGSTPAPASTVTAFTAKPLRPYCLNPGTTCGGQGRKHCGKCEQAHQQAQAAGVA